MKKTLDYNKCCNLIPKFILPVLIHKLIVYQINIKDISSIMNLFANHTFSK
jgi:hypothetical protein